MQQVLAIFFQFDHQKSVMTVLRNGSFKTSPTKSLYNNHLYDGNHNHLSILRSYKIDFLCNYALNYYPFDIQKCTMNFALGVSILIFRTFSKFKRNSTSQTVDSKYAKLNRGTLQYLGKIDLQEYYIIRYDFLDNEQIQVSSIQAR